MFGRENDGVAPLRMLTGAQVAAATSIAATKATAMARHIDRTIFSSVGAVGLFAGYQTSTAQPRRPPR